MSQDHVPTWAGGEDEKRRLISQLSAQPADEEPINAPSLLGLEMDLSSDQYLLYGFGHADPDAADHVAASLFGGVSAVALIHDWLRHALPAERETGLLIDILKAIPVRADLRHVPLQMMLWLITDRDFGACLRADIQTRAAMDDVAALYNRAIKGGAPSRLEWKAARAKSWQAGRRGHDVLVRRLAMPWWDPRRYMLPEPATWKAADVSRFAAIHGELGGAPYRGRGIPPVLRAINRAYDDVFDDVEWVKSIGAYRVLPAGDCPKSHPAHGFVDALRVEFLARLRDGAQPA